MLRKPRDTLVKHVAAKTRCPHTLLHTLQVHAPPEVTAAMAGPTQGGGSVLQAWFEAVLLFETLVRRLLIRHDGYECKAPEPGKFTLAFRFVDHGIDRGQCCLTKGRLASVCFSGLHMTIVVSVCVPCTHSQKLRRFRFPFPLPLRFPFPSPTPSAPSTSIAAA